MGMNAGQLNRRVQFLRAGLVDKGFGKVTGPFLPFGNILGSTEADDRCTLLEVTAIWAGGQ